MPQPVNGVSQIQGCGDRMPKSVTANPGQKLPARPRIGYRMCQQWPGANYFVALPDTVNENTPVLVTVHGISCNARKHVRTFSRYCNRLGWAVVAPLFSPNIFPKYQQLGVARKGGGPRSDFALNAVLNEVTLATSIRTDRIFMFGYSGGGQFVHRYAMAHPERVRSAVLGASGWYTFPDPDTRYPRGLGADSRLGGFGLSAEKVLRIPMAVIVGSKDRERDDALNKSPRIDRQQGLTRSARGQHWVAAMRAAASRRGLDTRYEFRELEGCGHSFSKCVRIGGMDRHAIEFLIDSTARSVAPGTGMSSQIVPAASFVA